MLTEEVYFYYQSPLSNLYLTVTGLQILKLEYDPQQKECFQKLLPDGEIKSWLDSYFSGQPQQQVPAIKIKGTAFQQKVWEVMLKIPYGETLSYGDVSNILDSAPRAVGQACKRNPVPILIPCHCIVAKQSIGGYEGATSGHRLDRKQWLLNHETPQ